MVDYSADIAAWAVQQAGFLRQRADASRSGHADNALDWANLAEEIEDVGISQKREVRSRLRVICQHLLKWEYQPEHRSRSWQATIRTQRREVASVLEDSPSLRPYAAAELDEAFAAAREDAEAETGLLHLPRECPWPIGQVLALDYLP